MIKAKHLQIELTNRCNLACAECPHRMMKRKQESIVQPVFQKMLQIMEPMNPATVIVHKDGEPLLHQYFDSLFADICRTLPEAKIDVYTNACYLSPALFEKLGEATIRNKVWFLVTMHGHKFDGTPYDLRGPSENVLTCLDIIETKKWKNIEFIISSHKTDFVNQRHMKIFYDFWISMKGKYSAIHNIHANTHINPWGQRIKMKEGMVHYEACPYSDGAHLFIGVTGNVLPCCMDLEEEIVFGNIMTDDLEEIESKRQAFYEVMRENKVREFELCQKCLS